MAARGRDPHQEIQRFLALVGQESLFQYLGITVTTPGEAALAALSERRRWAQTQQANPKFRDEARWIIRHQPLLRQVLVEGREGYLRQVEKRRIHQKLEVLTIFIRGTLVGGVMNAETERAVMQHAETFGVPEDMARRQLELLSKQLGVKREVPPKPAPRGHDQSLQALMGTVQDVIAQGVLSPKVINQELEKGRLQGIAPEQLRQRLERAADRARAQQTRANTQPQLRSRSLDERSSLDAELRSQAIHELVGTVRGALLQGIFGLSTARSIQQRGRQLGLDRRTTELLLAEAKRATESAMAGTLDPYTIFNAQPTADDSSLRAAYQDHRRWALGLPSQAESVQACVLLDVAWSQVRNPKARARYDEQAR